MQKLCERGYVGYVGLEPDLEQWPGIGHNAYFGYTLID